MEKNIDSFSPELVAQKRLEGKVAYAKFITHLSKVSVEEREDTMDDVFCINPLVGMLTEMLIAKEGELAKAKGMAVA